MNKKNMVFFSLLTFIHLLCGLLLCLVISVLAILGFSCLDALNTQSVICVSLIVLFTMMLMCIVGVFVAIFMCKLFTCMFNHCMNDSDNITLLYAGGKEEKQ